MGQFEQNFTYADALTTGDRVITLRYVLQMLADQRGMIASFMPKPFTDRTGSGMHLHLSLWRNGSGLFPSSGPDERGLGLDSVAYHFIGGLLEHAPALHALANPTVNSYKRTGATTTASGATWAPRFATGRSRRHRPGPRSGASGCGRIRSIAAPGAVGRGARVRGRPLDAGGAGWPRPGYRAKA